MAKRMKGKQAWDTSLFAPDGAQNVFSVLVSFWNHEQAHFTLRQEPRYLKTDLSLLVSILAAVPEALREDIAKISVAQHGGKTTAPWLKEFLKQNPDHVGGYAWFFGGKHLIKRRKS